MPLEIATYLSQLVSTNPVGATDDSSEGDDHIRLLKSVLLATFPNASKVIRFNGWEGRFRALDRKTGNYTASADVALGDDGKLLSFALSGAATLTLPSLASAGNGYMLYVYKDMSSVHLLTIDGAGSELINGSQTMLVGPGEGGVLVAGASSWDFLWLGAEPLPGQIVFYGGSTIPLTHLDCNGAAISRTTYARLFNRIGTVYGAGDGSTTFNLPDLRGRAAIGKGGQTAGRVTNSGTGNPGINGDTLAAAGGADRLTIPAGALPDHAHAVPAHAHGIGGSAPGSGGAEVVSSSGESRQMTAGSPNYFITQVTLTDSSTPFNTEASGSGQAMANMPPVIVLNAIIKI